MRSEDRFDLLIIFSLSMQDVSLVARELYERRPHMARLNLLNLNFGPRTHEGAPARNISTELQLRRSVLACLLWESQFYEDGVEIAGRIAELVPKVAAEKVAALAVEGREKMKLRHAPLLLVREMARHATHRALVAETLARVIQRADELAEFVAIYWKDGRVPLSAQVKKGLAAAFPKFDAYALAKYDRGGPIKLRDVLFLAHAKPRDEAQAEVWKRLIAGELTSPDTWEVALSSGADKRAAWERLLREQKLGALALLRNLRNMRDGGSGRGSRACRARIDEHGACASVPIPGGGALRSAVGRGTGAGHAQVCCGTREAAWKDHRAGRRFWLDDCAALSPFGNAAHRRSLRARGVAARDRREGGGVQLLGLAGRSAGASRLRSARRDRQVAAAQRTQLGKAVTELNQKHGYDRLIVITDEQAHDTVPAPMGKGYVINVASYKNGVGYGKWTHIDGWSESVVEYIRTLESTE